MDKQFCTISHMKGPMTSTAIAISAMNKRKNEEETHILPVGSVKEKDRVAIERMLDSSTLKQGTREHPTNTIFSLNVNEGEEILKPLLCERTPSVSSQKSEKSFKEHLEDEESEEIRTILNKQSTFKLRDSGSFSSRNEGSSSRHILRRSIGHKLSSEKDFLSLEEHSDLLKRNWNNAADETGIWEENSNQAELRVVHGILDPEGPMYLTFLYLTICLAIWASFVAPYNVAYLDCTTIFTFTNIMLYFSDMVFLVDVAVNFMLAVYKKGEWITDRRELALNYLTTGFAYDVFEGLPLDFILKVLYRPTGIQALRISLVGLFRLLRLKRLIKFFWEVGLDVKVDYFNSSIVKFSALIIFSAHWAATGFFLLARLRNFSDETWVARDEPDLPLQEPWVAYLTSIYWAMTTLSTCGYGDFSAYTPEERLWASAAMLFNLGLTAYVLGNITVLLTKADAQTASYRDKLTALNRYMKAHKVPSETVSQMRAHLKMNYESSEVRDDILWQLPSTLRLKLGKHVHSKVLDMSFLFRGTSQVFRDQLIAHLHTDFFVPNSTLLSSGDTVSEMYIIASGDCEVFLDGEFWFENGPGDCLGAFAFVCEMSLLWTVRTAKSCRMLVLERDSYETISNNHPEDGRIVVRNLQNRAKALSQAALHFKSQKVLDMSKLLSREVEAYIQKRDEETVMQLCYAAKRGDHLQVSRLVSGGFDLNMADYDGRTALHLAAAYGHYNVVEFFIEQGSPLSPRDCFYRTPLQEAVSASHWPTADLLRSHGAELLLRNEGTHMCRLVFQGHIMEIEHLLHYGANVDAADYDRRTAMHVAAAEGYVGIVRVLLAGGAEVNSVDRWGNTPLDEAIRSNNIEMTKVIKAHGGKTRKELI